MIFAQPKHDKVGRNTCQFSKPLSWQNSNPCHASLGCYKYQTSRRSKHFGNLLIFTETSKKLSAHLLQKLHTKLAKTNSVESRLSWIFAAHLVEFFLHFTALLLKGTMSYTPISFIIHLSILYISKIKYPC